MNVEQNIQFGMSGTADRENRTKQLLDLVDLNGYEKRRVHELSGGEAQRVALARAIAAEPGILLLDEPLSALDAPLRKRLREAIRDIHTKTNLTMIYVTHDREEAFAIADRIMILKDGTVQAMGKPEELYENPANLFVANFTGEGSVITMPQNSNNPEKNIAFVRLEDIRINDPTGSGKEGVLSLEADVIGCEYNGGSYIITLRSGNDTIKATSPTRYDSGSVTLGIPEKRIRFLS